LCCLKALKKKYFIAIVPPPQILAHIEEIKQELFEKYKLKGALRSPAHITLFRPFEWKTEDEAALIETLGKFRFEKPLEAELKNFNCFQPRVIYVDVMHSEILHELYAQLRTFCRSNLNLHNEDDGMRGFVPHVTVASRDLKKQLFYKLWDNIFKSREFSARFSVSNISLLRLENKWETIRVYDI
jgi:2'-5' RNA ligase